MNYKESLHSKWICWNRYAHEMLSFRKSYLLGNESVKLKSKQRMSALKRSFSMKNYPNYLIEHPNSRIAVYTAVFGKYDTIKNIGVKSPRCDYFIVTDCYVPEETGWTVKHIEFPEEVQNASNVMKNRFCKMNPHELFPDYEYSLYLDGSMEPIADLFPLLGRIGEHFLGMYCHNVRDCIYEEAKTVVRVGKAAKEEVEQLMARYELEGYPHEYGLTEGAIIIRKHNDSKCREVMQDWWEVFNAGPKRDQLSLMYCMWKHGYSMADIGILGIDYQLEPRLISQGHSKVKYD